MIKLNINNGRSIEVTQEVEDGRINVEILDSSGEVDYYYEIKPEELVAILNEYQYQRGII
jgi:hypothetical protein